jgi:hypothetical protein
MESTVLVSITEIIILPLLVTYVLWFTVSSYAISSIDGLIWVLDFLYILIQIVKISFLSIFKYPMKYLHHF